MHSLFSYEINRNGPTLMKAGRTILIKEWTTRFGTTTSLKRAFTGHSCSGTQRISAISNMMFSAFTIDVRRSDFWEMAIHHAITIILLSLSFTVNFVRIGTMVLICHDTADIIL
jgi:hypothetical protein